MQPDILSIPPPSPLSSLPPPSYSVSLISLLPPSQAGLEEQLALWSEETCIGEVVLKQSDALLRVYPPFVNFFDLSKEALQKCDKTFPRFHAFLKVSSCHELVGGCDWL